MCSDTRLQSYHTQGLGKNVMQLLSYAETLVGHRVPGLVGPRLHGEVSTFLYQLQVLPVVGRTAAQGEGPNKQCGVGRELSELHGPGGQGCHGREQDHDVPGCDGGDPGAGPGGYRVGREEQPRSDHRRAVTEGDHR